MTTSMSLKEKLLKVMVSLMLIVIAFLAFAKTIEFLIGMHGDSLIDNLSHKQVMLKVSINIKEGTMESNESYIN